MEGGFEVFAYSARALKRTLCGSLSPSGVVAAKAAHLRCLGEYLNHESAKTIVVEHDYIDRDYLEDFSAFYVRCFEQYGRVCKRLHFFDFRFSATEFSTAVAGGTKRTKLLTSRLRKGYIGFMVVKPLPETKIGRTCLRTYLAQEGRSYPIVRSYEAHLFGIALTVESLAFQEQDRVAAVCATSALWSVFHGTGMRFHHRIPSPVEITRSATEQLPLETRTLPNDGLTPVQLAHAIRAVGLEPELVNADNDYLLRRILYGYLRGELPVLLGIDLFECAHDGGRSACLGRHAVAVTGYHLREGKAVPLPGTDFHLRASRIDKIYVHDDQVGPFARMHFDGPDLRIQGTDVKRQSMRTSWRSQKSKTMEVVAMPDFVLIPLYHKIRLRFEAVHKMVFAFDRVINRLRENARVPFSEALEWEIYLTSVTRLKEDLGTLKIDEKQRRRLRLSPMPRFIWRACAFHQGNREIELLFDATDIEQGRCLFELIDHRVGLADYFRAIAKSFELPEEFRLRGEAKIFEWFASPI